MNRSDGAETFGFQAEVKELLHLMVHSLYSDREIFLRELVSNASDANDKLRFEALARPELLGSSELCIRVAPDSDARELSVIDNGIGMSREEVIRNLGTIAESGTSGLLRQMSGEQKKDSKLIGQFGVGFYSAFMVADEVEVLTRRADLSAKEGVRWVSDGKGEYSVEQATLEEPGTTVRLRLKADASEFTDATRVRALVRKYSDHVAFPIRMASTGDEHEDGTGEEETVNHAQALWTRPRNEISDDEYREFYRHIAHDFAEPLIWSHNTVEGKHEYTSLLYVPSVAPFDLWNRENPRGVKVYVQRVYITDQATQFLPLYLRFIRGVLDSRDLSLNVSREILQQDPVISSIRSALTKRVLDMLSRLAKDEADKYATFWEQFGTVLKEGLAEDAGNRERIAALLRFHSSHPEGETGLRSLADYVAAALEWQKEIYYLIAETPAIAKSSPHLEVFRERDVEVLFLTDRIDEWMLQFLTGFEGKSLRDITRGELDLDALGDSSKAKEAEPQDSHEAFVGRVRGALGDRVAGVRVSARLKESAACLVLAEHDIGAQMRAMLKAAGHEAPENAPVLELNLRHPLVARLEHEADDGRFAALARVVLDQAVLAEGRPLEDPAAYLSTLNELMLELGLAASGGDNGQSGDGQGPARASASGDD